MNILSLFDGMSCGRIALERAGIPVTNYFASEIDKYAIQVSKANWPDIKHVGSVTDIWISYDEDFDTTRIINIMTGEDYSFRGKFALIIGGSPCQGFSFAGLGLNFEDPRSKLFFEFVRLMKVISRYNPEAKFFLENVKMKKEHQDVITGYMGVEPVLHNSALVSAQNRKRLYWTNIPFLGQPRERGIVLKDILEGGADTVLRWQNKQAGAVLEKNKGATPGTDIRKRMQVQIPNEQIGVILDPGEYKERNEKVMCLDASYYKGADNRGQRTLIKSNCIQVGLANDVKGFDATRRIDSAEGKCPTLLTGSGGHHTPKITQINPSKLAAGLQPYMQDRVYHVEGKSIALTAEFGGRLKVGEDMFTYRKLTPVECERLQCVEDNYTASVSNTQRYKMLGNGWNAESVTHFFLGLNPAYAFLF